LIATTTLGGKSGWTTASRPFLQASEALLEEPLAPLADDLPPCVEPGSDLIVAHALGSKQRHLRADDVPIL
jgi:hypothetical protein